MLFKRFYDDSLAQASYMIACERTREAVFVDPNVDIARYQRAAAEERVRIAHVTETHIHADFVSGAAELARATRAELHLSAEGGEEWGYPASVLRTAHALRERSTISLGDIVLEAIHTPGHTPEHMIFLVTDLARGREPLGALTGDFIFVADVGRPDLLERVAGAVGSTDSLAVQVFRSIQRIKSLPDHLLIWPGHGAGSACGKSLGSMPQSTLGYEKLFNWAFGEMSEREFVARALEHQPVPPRYFSQMKKINRAAAPAPEAARPQRLDLPALESALRDRATVVDTRPAESFAKRHVTGTLNIPLNKSFLTWAGALVPYDRELFLIADRGSAVAVSAIAGDLRKIGLVRIGGYFSADILNEWQARQGALEKVPQIDAAELKARRARNDTQVIDVRAPDEWDAGHLPGAVHIPLAALPDRMSELDPSVPIVLHCKGGGRSAIATSLLQSRGIADVSNLTGGYDAWVARGFEVEARDSCTSGTSAGGERSADASRSQSSG